MLVALVALVFAMSGTAVAANALVNGDKLIAKHSLSGNRLRDHTVTGQQIKALVWHPLTLENGWTAYGAPYDVTPAYAKDAQGFVHLRGTLSGSARTSALFAHLPAAVRPTSAHAWVTVSSTNGSYNPQVANLDISGSDGSIIVYFGPGATGAFVSLEGVQFFR
jgi:hypothetical protein